MRPHDRELAQLFHRFVPVRITNFRGVDMNRFRFDYDLTFAILLMNADGHTYARFGTRDAHSAAARMSIAGLKQAMRDVLARHKQRTTQHVRVAGRQNPYTVDDIPAFRRSKAAKEECAHCHYANNFRFTQRRAEGKFSKEMLFQYPLPENIGITLEVDRNNRVKSIGPGSPAARAGIRLGDVIVRANETPVLTSADLQFALNPLPDPATVTLHLQRGGKPVPPKALRLPAGWRRTDVSWRASQESIPPSVGIWGEALTEEQKQQRGLPAGKLALRVTFLFPGPEWAKTRSGLQQEDVIVGLDGRPLPAMTVRQFHSHFRLTYNVGDIVTLNVRRGDQRLELPVPCIEVQEG